MTKVFEFTFKTAPAPSGTDPDADLDLEPPTIVSTSPFDGETGVPLNSVITVTFSEAIDPASITSATFDVSSTKSARIFVSGEVATFEPEVELEGDKTLTVTLSTGIKDLAGNALAVAFSWDFSTESEGKDEEF